MESDRYGDEFLKREFPHFYQKPRINPSVFLAPGSQVYGDVEIGAQSSLWFNAVIRGDVHFVCVGERTNIQDLSMVHVSHKTFPARIGHDVTVGHSAVIHACTIGNFVLVGMGSVVLDGAEIGDYVLLGAGSLVTPNTRIPSGVKAFGRPARVVAQLTEAEREAIRISSEHYVSLAKAYRSSNRSSSAGS